MKKTIIYSIFIGIISILMIGLVILISVKASQNEIGHKYITTYVVDKYYTDGYCWAFGCYNTDFVIVSVEKDEKGQEVARWTSHVSLKTYNNYDINSVMYICVNHEKVHNEE